MLLGYGINEYGILSSAHICDFCGTEFTVCPAKKKQERVEGCLSTDCASYDMNRDTDLWFSMGLIKLKQESTE